MGELLSGWTSHLFGQILTIPHWYPLLVLARLQNYIPALQKYIGHRNRDLLSDIHQRARDSRQQFRGQPRGADPLDRFEDPVRETRVNLKPDIGGLGAQYEKQQASEERARRQQDPQAKAPATPFGWHPTLNRGQGSGSQKPPEPDLPPKSTAAASTDSVPLQPQPPQHPPEDHQSGKPARTRSPPVSPRGRSAGKGTPKVPVVLKPAADKASLRKSSAPSRPKAEKVAVEKRAASAPSSNKAKGTSPIRKVFLQKKLVPTPPSTPPPGTPAKGAASGAPSPTSVAEPKQVQSKGERTPAEKRKSSTSGSDRERTRSEPVRQSRQKRLRASAPSKPLVLRSRTGDQVTRTDESGTWALITPADPSKVGTTTISGERAARRVRSGEETETYTREKWTVGPKTTLISYASEDSSSSEELLPAEEGQDRPPTRQQRQRPRSPSSESSSSSHRSTSSGSQAQLPRGRREEPDILQGTIEAPIADIEPRQPTQRPPQEKRQRVQFGRRDIPTVQSTPLAKTAARQQGAAAPVAHQATTPAATEVKQEGKAKKSKPPPKAPTTVAAEDRERSRSTTNKVPYKPPPAIQSKGVSQSSPPPAQTWFRNTNPPPLEPQSIPERPKGPLLHLQQQLSLARLHHKRYLSNGQGKRQLKELPPALQALHLVDLHHIGIHLLQEISLQCRLEGITIPDKPGLRTFDLGTGHPSRLLWTGTVFWTSWLTTLVFLKKGHCNLFRHSTPDICPSNSSYCHLQDKKDQRASKINFVFSLETQLVEVCPFLVSG